MISLKALCGNLYVFEDASTTCMYLVLYVGILNDLTIYFSYI